VSDDHFLSRWSKRKLAANRGEVAEKPAPPPAGAPSDATPAIAAPAQAQPAEPLPPVESLTAESDFSPFMRPGTDPGVKREALKVLMRDPRFNVMDGLDVYIDDYSKPDPIPAEWMSQLSQLARLGDYRPPEAEIAEKGENAPAPAQIESKPEPEQTVAEVPSDERSDEPSDTVNKGDGGTKVQQS